MTGLDGRRAYALLADLVARRQAVHAAAASALQWRAFGRSAPPVHVAHDGIHQRMHILLIGNGGREHALAWKLARSPRASRLSVAPGNPGTAAEPRTTNVPIAVDAIDELVAFAREQAVALVVIGPEVPLVAGLADRLRSAGIACVGPNADGAQLEGSKAFAKDFMHRHGIPTAASQSFTDLDDAKAFIAEHGAPIVIKADGLAAGKGVVVAQQLDAAHRAVEDMLSGNRFGDAGHRVVVESFLAGEEASFIALVSGEDALPFATSQDHKARDEGDTGPNTGGMGAYSPAPVVTEAVRAHVIDDILRPTVAGLIADGVDYRGFLYVGLMIDATGRARVVEYNVRLGDPETQPLLMRLDSDLVDLLLATAEGSLEGIEASWSARPAIGVVIAAGDYPDGGSRGAPITGLAKACDAGCTVFHAGTAERDGTLVTNGGRVLCVTATGEDLAGAKACVDKGAAAISWDGARFRGDIGHRALQRDDGEA